MRCGKSCGVAPLQDDRKGSSLLYDGSARQARGEFWGGEGNPKVGEHGRRKRPHPAQPDPRPYGYEAASKATL